MKKKMLYIVKKTTRIPSSCGMLVGLVLIGDCTIVYQSDTKIDTVGGGTILSQDIRTKDRIWIDPAIVRHNNKPHTSYSDIDFDDVN